MRPLFALAVAGACCAVTLPAGAQGAGARSEPKPMRSWLIRIHEAASHQNFQGTFIVSASGAMSSARIAHYCEGANQFERIDSLDGQARHVYRYNDVVHTVWPQQQVAQVEQRDLLPSFPALLQVGDDRIGDFYEVQSQGADRVAGYEANVLQLRPRDGLRFGYRLWSEKASGLLLRADVIGERGQILETSAFSDVSIGVKSQPELVLQPMKKLDGYRVVRPVFTPTRLEDEGWSMRQAVPGFRQVSSIKRPLDSEGTADARGARQVLQTIFSDGLTYVSVFIEPFNADRHGRETQTTIGATQTLMRRQGDWWLTLVGDVPVVTLRTFAVALERKR